MDQNSSIADQRLFSALLEYSAEFSCNNHCTLFRQGGYPRARTLRADEPKQSPADTIMAQYTVVELYLMSFKMLVNSPLEQRTCQADTSALPFQVA